MTIRIAQRKGYCLRADAQDLRASRSKLEAADRSLVWSSKSKHLKAPVELEGEPLR